MSKNKHRKHGLCKHPIYQTWENMKKRCINPNHPQYKDYGARNINICSEWLHDPEAFIGWAESQENYNKEGYSLDRIDNNLGYFPDNCRFTSMHIQNTNRRIQKSNTSGFVGISYRKNNKTWVAKLAKHNKKILEKYFPTKQDALECRNNFITSNNLTEYKLQPWKDTP